MQSKHVTRAVGAGMAVAAVVSATSAMPPVQAAPGTTFADQSIVRTSDDGWTVRLTKSAERIHSVPALSQGHGSYEAFLDLRGSAEVSGNGSSPVNAAVLSTGFTVSCQWQMDGVQAGISGGPTISTTISWPPAANLGVQVMPSISTTLRNGATQEVVFSKKQLAGRSAATSMEGVKIDIAGCVGLAKPAVRSWVRFSMNTRHADNTFNLYGRPHRL